MDPSDIGIFLRCTSPQTLNPKPQTHIYETDIHGPQRHRHHPQVHAS